MRKRLLCLLLGIAMIVSVLPFSVMADESGTTADVAKIGDVSYKTLAAAFENVKTGDTVTLLRDVTITEQINIKKALNGLTFDGNGKTVTLATTTDPSKPNGSGFYFGNPDESLWCTGIAIKDLNIVGTARFAIFLSGGTTSTFTNVNISGQYLYAVNLYGTHGATFTNCKMSNSLDLGDDNENGAAIWSNVAAANPVILQNSDLGIIGINRYTTSNILAPKIFVDEHSTAVIHTYDDGAVSGSPLLCVSDTSKGNYVVKTKNSETNTWEAVKNYAAQIGTVKYNTLYEAIDALQDGDTLTLLDNVAIDKPESNAGVNAIQIPANIAVTIDLNGKTITKKGPMGNWGEVQTSAIINKGTLTITDLSAEQTGKIVGGGYNYCSGAVIKNYGTLNVEGGRFESGAGTNGMDQSGHYVIFNLGTANLSGGYFFSNSKGTALIRNDVKMTITGGVFEQKDFLVLRNADTVAEMEISGNTLVKYTTDRSIQNYGTVTIHSGEFNGDIHTISYNDHAAKTTINNGTINGKMEAKKSHTVSYTGEIPKSIVAVCGGTFSQPVPIEFCAEGFIPADNGSGIFGVTEGAYAARIGNAGYDTLADAITAAASGDTVTMLQDVNADVVIPSEKTVKLDLAGKKLTNVASHTIYNNGTLTVIDSVGGGVVDNITHAKAAVYNVYGATANLNGGTFNRSLESIQDDSNRYYVLDNRGKVVINAATVKKQSASLNASSLINNQSAGDKDEFVAELTINQGAYIESPFIAIKNGSVSQLFINGGVIKSTEKAILNYGVAIITDAAITGVVEACDHYGTPGSQDPYYGNIEIRGGTFDGDVIATALDDGTDAIVTIKGGTFNGKIQKEKYIDGLRYVQDNMFANANIFILNGTFKNPVPEEFCPLKYVVAQNEDGTYGVVNGNCVITKSTYAMDGNNINLNIKRHRVFGSGKIMVAGYKNDNLVSMDMMDVTDSAEYSATLTNSAEIDTVKIFVWSSITEMIPLGIAEVISVIK